MRTRLDVLAKGRRINSAPRTVDEASKMKYRHAKRLSREELQAAAESGDERVWVEAMLDLARFDPDLKWTESYILEQLEEPSLTLRWGAIQALAELAGRHGISNKELVIGRLRQAGADIELSGIVGDAIDDIESFTTTE